MFMLLPESQGLGALLPRPLLLPSLLPHELGVVLVVLRLITRAETRRANREKAHVLSDIV